MYVPERFREADPRTIRDFMTENSFATLVTMDAARPIATHLPVLVRDGPGGLQLQGHLSRENPQWATLDRETRGPGAEVLVIFPGAHAYVSAGWYAGPGVPTWNYMSVHAYGTPRLMHGDELLQALRELVRFHEARETTGKRYDLDGLPEGFVRGMMKGIVGFSIEVTRLEASFKLSQRADPADRASVVRQLSLRGDESSRRIADAMRRMPG